MSGQGSKHLPQYKSYCASARSQMISLDHSSTGFHAVFRIVVCEASTAFGFHEMLGSLTDRGLTSRKSDVSFQLRATFHVTGRTARGPWLFRAATCIAKLPRGIDNVSQTPCGDVAAERGESGSSLWRCCAHEKATRHHSTLSSIILSSSTLQARTIGIRSSPQVGFSLANCKVKSTITCRILGRPGFFSLRSE